MAPDPPSLRPARRAPLPRGARDLLEPFRPTRSEPWDFERAAHLLRRAGFGGPPEEAAELVELGPEAAVARLVDFPDGDPELEAEIAALGSSLRPTAKEGEGGQALPVERLRDWWLFRLAYARHPLREKLALFWHDHFATSAGKVAKAELMLAQNELFRRMGASSFRELLHELARDPAMLHHLDNRLSRKQAPNENWARELLELFTLGVDRYSQEDVEEVARAFTGWTTAGYAEDRFAFDPDRHDAGDKQLFGEPLRGRGGEQGIEEGRDVLERILARPDCAHFVAGKLLGWFAVHAPAEEVRAALASRLVQADWSVREALRALFLSRWFHSAEVRWKLYKTPVDFLASAVRSLGVQNAHLMDLSGRAERMGMTLFEPPSVAGWGRGRDWIQSSYLIQRFDLALALSELPHTARRVAGSPALDLDRLAGEGGGNDRALAERAASFLLHRPLRDEQRAALVEHLQGVSRARRRSGGRDAQRAKARALVHLILCTPEFALA